MTFSSVSFTNTRNNCKKGEYLLYCNQMQRAAIRISKSKDNLNRLYYCCQYANIRDDYHFFKWISLEGFGDNNTQQEPQEVVQIRMYVVDEEFKHILTKIELIQKVILAELLPLFLFYV